MQIEINPEAEFSTGEAERMLGITTKGRVKLLIEKDLVPARRVSNKSKNGTGSHYRVKFKDFPKILEADSKVKSLSRSDPKTYIRRSEWESLESRVAMLEGLIDEYTYPEVASTPAAR